MNVPKPLSERPIPETSFDSQKIGFMLTPDVEGLRDQQKKHGSVRTGSPHAAVLYIQVGLFRQKEKDVPQACL